MSVNCLGMALDAEEHSVRFWPSRTEERAYLEIDGDGTHYEIQMERVHVEAVCECLPDVLAGLDRWAVENVARERAAIAMANAVDDAVRALENAAEAADSATDSLIYITSQAETALRTKRDDVQPSELVDR